MRARLAVLLGIILATLVAGLTQGAATTSLHADRGPRVPMAVAPTIQGLSFSKIACPAGITNPAELEAAGGQGACAVVLLPGQFPLPSGAVWAVEPIEMNLEMLLTQADASTLTMADASPSGGGFCGPSASGEPDVCHAGMSYSWIPVLVGATSVQQAALPEGYVFGWVQLLIDEQDVTESATVDPATRTISFETKAGDQHVSILFVDVAAGAVTSSAPTARTPTATAPVPPPPGTSSAVPPSRPDTRWLVPLLSLLLVAALALAAFLPRSARRR